MWGLLRAFTDFRSKTVTESALEDAFRGKLLAAFYLAGPTASVGWTVGYWLQQRFQNPFIGQYSVPVVNMVVTTLAFQIVWWLGSRELYIAEARSPGQRFRLLERDLLPVHWTGIRIGMSFNLVTWAVVSGIIWVLEIANRTLAINLPASTILLIYEFVFVNSPFMRLMGDYFESHAKELAAGHFARLPAELKAPVAAE